MTSRQARINEAVTPVALTQGAFISTNEDGSCQVDFGEGEVTVRPVGMFHRTPGQSVTVLQVGATSVIIGAGLALPSAGEVVTVGPLTAIVNTVLTDDVELPWIGATPSPGDDVAIVDGWIVGVASLPPSTDYEGPGAPAGGTRTLDFRATDSGNYYIPGAGWSASGEVWCSDNNIGCWFYGNSIGDSIPDGAVINEVSVFVPEFYNQFPGSLATIGVHGLAAKSGAPTVTSAVTVSAGAGWKSLPTTFGDALKTGASRGLGTDTGGFHKAYGRNVDADSGLLRIKFTT